MEGLIVGNSGIYAIVNTVNFKIYVGSSSNLNSREYKHKHLLKNGKHHSQHLQNAYQYYGPEVFTFELIEYVEPELNQLLNREQFYLDNLKPDYNCLPIAGSHLGSKRNPKTVERMRLAQNRPEVKQKISQSQKGHATSELTKKKISESMKAYHRGKNG